MPLPLATVTSLSFGRRAVVLEGHRRGARVAGFVDAARRERGRRIVRAGVRDGRAGVDPRAGVRARRGHRDRVVVPAVRVGGPRERRGHAGRRRVVLERGRAARRVPGLVGAGALHGRRRRVGAAVARRRARVDPRGRVGAGEGDRDRRGCTSRSRPEVGRGSG